MHTRGFRDRHAFAPRVDSLGYAGPLAAVSPLDGRYARYTAPLSEHVSEAALVRARVRVEVEYLLALADLDATPFELDRRNATPSARATWSSTTRTPTW